MELVSPRPQPRLHPDRLAALPAAVARPGYRRDALTDGIVHLGVGAFQRGHLAAVNDAAAAATGDLSWGISGVSLRSPDTRDALEPQQGLYTLALRDADPATGQIRDALQVIGCLSGVLVAPDDPAVVLERIAAPATRIVSLTVTEKGYCHDPATGELQAGHPDIVHDLAHPSAPRSAVGFLVHGLALRHARGLAPLTLLSLDNLPSNGHVLRGLVLDLAQGVDAGLAQWIAAGCRFPCSMVDRIVPRTTDADRARIAVALGVTDAWPVVAEPFLEWVVEDDFAAGRPDWARGGARFVVDAKPFETLKLRMVNGAHSALAYLGAVAGFETVDAAMAEPALHGYLDRMLRDEVQPTLPPLPGLDVDGYCARLLDRFANPALAHKTAQIAMDGSQKLPQRLLGTLRDRLAAGAPIEGLALAVAAWLHYLRGMDEAGRRYPIQDPLAAELAARLDHATATVASLPEAERGVAWVGELFGFAPVFGDLAGAMPAITAVATQLQRLRAAGVIATLRAL